MRSGTIPSLLMAAAIAAPAAAQQESDRAGFGMSFGIGGGSAGVTCEGCPDSDRLNGLSGYLRLGGYVSPRFFVGVESTGWLKNDPGIERRIAAGSIVFLGYPSETAGFFLRSGAGFLRAVIETDIAVLVGEGFTWQLGAGWDVSLGSGAALTPYITFLNSAEVALVINDLTTGVNVNPNIVQLGLAITVH